MVVVTVCVVWKKVSHQCEKNRESGGRKRQCSGRKGKNRKSKLCLLSMSPICEQRHYNHQIERQMAGRKQQLIMWKWQKMRRQLAGKSQREGKRHGKENRAGHDRQGSGKEEKKKKALLCHVLNLISVAKPASPLCKAKSSHERQEEEESSMACYVIIEKPAMASMFGGHVAARSGNNN